MAHTLPTAAELKARLPAFSSVDDTMVNTVIAEISRFVDETWDETDYKTAAMYLAAHYMAREGLIGGQAAGGVTGPLVSESFGDASRTFASPSSSTASLDALELQTTIYGKRFAELRKLNRGAGGFVV
jgi:hypothetical protein